jgi:tellurite resistance protein TerC
LASIIPSFLACPSLTTLLPTLAQEAATASSPADLKIWAYAGFVLLVLIFLALDLGVFHREAHEVGFKEAATWSVVWITMALLFAGFVYYGYERHWLGLGLNVPMYNPSTEPGAAKIILGEVTGAEATKQFLTGYVIEKSLSMDNVFVIALIFGFFAVPNRYQHRVLFWGILGALIMRAIMIFIGAELVRRFEWILVIFGLFLVLTAVKMAVVKSEPDPSKNPIVRLVKKYMRLTEFYDGQKFFTKRTLPVEYTEVDGKKVALPAPPGTLSKAYAATPLLLALVLVEVTDLIFAVDSIPAIFAITPDPFIVFTSNIFAILGLRALYFCLAALIEKFRYLKPALILILAFVGAKLLLLSVPPYIDDVASWVGMTVEPMKAIKIDTIVSLGVVVGLLVLATVASILRPLPDSKTDSTKH